MFCPECGRKKAQNVQDSLLGMCPKWWAIRDPDAEEDCKRHSEKNTSSSCNYTDDDFNMRSGANCHELSLSK